MNLTQAIRPSRGCFVYRPLTIWFSSGSTSWCWEMAARGTTGTVFLWGDQRTAAKCNVRETGVGTTTSVSRYHSGVSPYGVYDMVGNVWEWCSTKTTPGRYELKGSAFTSPLFRGEPAAWNDANDFMQDDDTGFRCACSADQMASALPNAGQA
jgi:formylglycine-generating enzyme required for sulfatase activity